MSSCTRTKFWDQTSDPMKRHPVGLELPHPTGLSQWIDDIKLWPAVSYKNIFNYLVLLEGVDGDVIENYKSMTSYNYFQSSKVGPVMLNEHADGYLFLKAEVTPSLSVNSSKHKAWVLITTQGVVETAGCSCIAGKGKSCSHAGAILWKLEYATSTGLSGTACTDVQQKWNQGTSRNIAPRRLVDMHFARYTPVSEYGEDEIIQTAEPIAEMPHFVNHGEFETEVQSFVFKDLFYMPGTTFKKSLTAKLRDPSQPTLEVVEHTCHTCELSCDKCAIFFNKYVNINDEQRLKLEIATKKQSLSEIWHDSRKIRITASSAKGVPVRDSTDPEKCVRRHLYPTFKGNFATRHGQSCESLALADLMKAGLAVTAHGTVVCSEEPWLSASPDGVCGEILIEVKCPIINVNENLLAVMADRCCCDSRLVGGEAVLNKKGPRGYYLQVQLAMYCLQFKLCKFCIWTKENHVIIDVPFDQSFVEASLLRLKSFYFKKMLPRIVDEFNANRLKLCREYTNICKE